MVIKNFLDPEGRQNCMTGSKVMAILLNGWILGGKAKYAHRVPSLLSFIHAYCPFSVDRLLSHA